MTFDTKVRLESHLGGQVNGTEYQFLDEQIHDDPMLTLSDISRLLDAYRRGHEDGYLDGKLDWQGES